jgi:UDP-glucose 4-epimerase
METESHSKVLVTGGAGFIGSHLVDWLIKENYETVVIDNLSSGKISNINERARFYQVDITDPIEVTQVFEQERPEMVLHYAAQTSVAFSIINPSVDAMVNIVGSLNIFEAARKFEVRRMVLASTGGAIYGEPKTLPCAEGDIQKPLAPYGISKLTMENFSSSYGLYGLGTVILRLGNVYGPRQDPNGEAGVIAIFTGKMLLGEDIVVYGQGEQQRDFVYVDDVVEASMKVLFSKDVGVYNIASGVGVSVNTIIDKLRDLIRWQGKVIHQPARTGEVLKIFLSSTKALNAFGWIAKVPLNEGLKKTVTYVGSQAT